MRKLRKAALVAAMIGSLSMAGAGVASATDYGNGTDDKKTGDTGTCVNNIAPETGNSEGLLGSLLGLNLNNNAIAILGNASATQVVQQSCAVGDGATSFNISDVTTVQNNEDLLDLNLL
jgi:hypothetical protein